MKVGLLKIPTVACCAPFYLATYHLWGEKTNPASRSVAAVSELQLLAHVRVVGSLCRYLSLVM